MAAPGSIKGILKNKNRGSGTKTGPQLQVSPAESQDGLDPGFLDEKKSQKWDEMNILATYHPADKDYGLMKIDEPSTPYNRMLRDDGDEGALSDSESNTALTPDELARKLAVAEGAESRFMREEEEEEESSEEEEELTPEEQEKKKQFEMMRKRHYNEGQNIKLARQLIASELEEEEEEEAEMKGDTEMEDVSEDPQDADSLDF